MDLLILLVSCNSLALWVLLVLDGFGVNLDVVSVRLLMVGELNDAWLDTEEDWNEED